MPRSNTLGRVTERIRLTNVFESGRSVEIDALVDTGATMLALPQNIVDELNLRKMREVPVRYANNTRETRPVYGLVTVEIRGRSGEFNVLGQPVGSQPLIGQVVLEQLDFLVDPGREELVPRFPEGPVIDLLLQTT